MTKAGKGRWFEEQTLSYSMSDLTTIWFNSGP